MTIAGWIVFGAFAVIVLIFGIAFAVERRSKGTQIAITIATILIAAGIIVGGLLWFKYSASGQRALIDQKSNLSGGIERTINVYTANGDTIATYTGKIDIADADGGYVKFDFEGKRYIYYNCFVETIADIE